MLFTSKKGHEVTNKQSAISVRTVIYWDKSLAINRQDLMQLIIVLRFISIIIIAVLRSASAFLTYSNYDFLIRYFA
jgi:hypothetical protein